MNIKNDKKSDDKLSQHDPDFGRLLGASEGNSQIDEKQYDELEKIAEQK